MAKTHVVIRRFPSTPYEYDVDRLEVDSTTPMPQQTLRFMVLPPEVRNRIYEECFLLARTYEDLKTDHQYRRQYRPIRVSFTKSMVQISNLHALPLLFANKQIHEEMVGLVYPHFELDTIAIELITFHDCTLACTSTCTEFSSLTRWPNMQRFVSGLKLEITMCTLVALWRRSASLGYYTYRS
jgi:hypothetical protein